MILKSLKKVITDKAEGIMVVPQWPTQPWYPIFKKLMISKPIIFQADENLIVSSDSSRGHIHSTITLVAGLLSGKQL
jgi:hypothetical protein